MDYNFNYTLEGNHKMAASLKTIRLSHAPLLLDSTLIQIAHVMEQSGRIQGQRFRIRTIGVQSDYLPPDTAPRLIELDKL